MRATTGVERVYDVIPGRTHRIGFSTLKEVHADMMASISKILLQTESETFLFILSFKTDAQQMLIKEIIIFNFI